MCYDLLIKRNIWLLKSAYTTPSCVVELPTTQLYWLCISSFLQLLSDIHKSSFNWNFHKLICTIWSYPPYHPIVYLHLNGKWSIIFYSNSLFVANIIKCDLTQVENKSPNLCRVWSWKIIILNINLHNFLRFHLFYIFMNLKNTVYEVKIINIQWYLCIMCVGLNLSFIRGILWEDGCLQILWWFVMKPSFLAVAKETF